MVGSKFSSLGNRVITGALGASGLIFLILKGGLIGIFVFTLFLSLSMILEFSKATFKLPDKTEKIFFLLSVTWIVQILGFLQKGIEMDLLVGSFVLVFTYFLFTSYRNFDNEENRRHHFHELTYSIFSLIYLVFTPMIFLKLREFHRGEFWVLYFLLLVWATDIAGYFVGISFGKRRLYEMISPQKTIEGAIGGVAFSLIVSVCFKMAMLLKISTLGAICIPILVGTFAQIGDLCESMLKRTFSIKDTGGILPGHGGVLDRFDGVVFALPIMYMCQRLFY